ncbi:toll/interleukin-1 receptor domain-containing protein [Colwellia sp. BRX9-1]|uniref:toll/interleukin-1 receptor domain-containing protein n=1 Tax=Colwellia sp. BRX9-1 TaxID=2759830 RepID=UPI0015F74585|nr:toll/interleukin-1 receptor domain-containing protein [Colwellia sp. BRX9-1]MBA6352724.1 toll/interleukin-1 receptor domain-containing protein [Colwellia sp. BRX9-1]
MYDCFISYKVEADDNVAFQLSSLLQDNDFKVFVDKKSLLPGQNWADELQHSVTQSNYVFAIFTQDYIARVVEGNCNGDNFIIEELNWALKDNKLIPIGIGVTVEEIATCFDLVPSLKPIQFQMFPTDLSEQCFHIILNKLYKRIYLKDSKAKSIIPVSHPVNVSGTALSSEDAYLKLEMPWDKCDAIEYRKTLENKVNKSSLDYVILAKFHLLGRFDIKISPDIAYQNLQNAVRKDCKEAYYEFGLLHESKDTKYCNNDIKATDYYTKAHKLGYMPATYRLAMMFDEKTENNNCPTSFLKKKYGIAHSNQFTSILMEKENQYQQLSTVEKYFYTRTQLFVNENKSHAIKQMEELASIGYSHAVDFLGSEYLEKDGDTGQNIQKSLDYLHTGDELGYCYSRYFLASIHLESTYAELDFVKNVEFGIQKHQQNIELNYHYSSCSLVWALQNVAALKHIMSTEKLIRILECGENFGHIYCVIFLAELYMDTKNTSLIPLIISALDKGNLEPLITLFSKPLLCLCGELLVLNGTSDLCYNSTIIANRALRFYNESYSAGNTNGDKIYTGLLYLAVSSGENNISSVISSLDGKDHYYRAAGTLLRSGYGIFDSKLEKVFFILKKGAENGCDKCNDWLLMIFLRWKSKEYEDIACAEDYDSLFWRKFIQANKAKTREEDFKISYVNIGGSNDSVYLSTIKVSNTLSYMAFTKRCEINLLTPSTPTYHLLHNFIDLKVGQYSEAYYNVLCMNKEYKSTFDLSNAFYIKLVQGVKNRNDSSVQRALWAHTIYLLKAVKANPSEKMIAKNEGHISWCIVTLTHDFSDDCLDDPPSLRDFFSNFEKLYNIFITDGLYRAFSKHFELKKKICYIKKLLDLRVRKCIEKGSSSLTKEEIRHELLESDFGR